MLTEKVSICFCFTTLLFFLLEIRDPVFADAQGMKPELHFVDILVIHMGAQFIVGDKTVIGVAESVEHGAVFGTQLSDIHDKPHGSAHKKADEQIERAEDDDDGNNDSAYHQAGAKGDDGVPLGADSDQLRLGRIHCLDQGESGAEIEKKLS